VAASPTPDLIACRALVRGPTGGLDPISCEPTPHGAWGIEATRQTTVPCASAGGAPPPTCSGTRLEWRLVHVSTSGARTIGPTGAIEHDGIGLPGGHRQTVFLTGSFDYDGDGEPEAFVTEMDEDHVSQVTKRITLWRFAAGKIGSFGPSEHVYETRDVDCDGRPDLLVLGSCPCFAHDGSGYYRPPNMCPELLRALHSRPDGSFSADDSVARASVRTCADAGT
jgi:hypothetical protein